MKKILSIVLATAMVFSLTACSKSSDKKENNEPLVTETGDQIDSEEKTIKINSLNGSKEKIVVEVPYNPQRIAVLDLAALDIIDSLGLGERVVGTARTSIEYLASYSEDKAVKNLGTIKEVDLESVMACDPEVIFIGGRLAGSYDALTEIAPVVYLSTDLEKGVLNSIADNATTIASMFGLVEQVATKMADFDTRIGALQQAADGKTALIGMTTSGSFNLLGNDGRCSIIGVEIGFNNVGLGSDALAQGEGGSGARPDGNSTEANSGKDTATQGTTSSHGNEASFELVLDKNPDYIFVMDRDRAISSSGAQLAQEIMENELVKDCDAYKNSQIIYLENPAVWYTAEGGIKAFDIMLADLENYLLAK